MNSKIVADGTNTHFSHVSVARAQPEAVWRLWTEVDTWPRWDTELESARLDGPFVVGAKGALKGKGAPEASFEVVAFEPLVRNQISTALPLGGQLVIERTLERDGQTTRFTHDVRFRGFGGWLLSPFFGPRYREALPEVMARIVKLAEGPQP